MLKCDRVYEKSKQRLKLREAGYSGLTLLFSELHITPTLVRSLLDQVLSAGEPSHCRLPAWPSRFTQFAALEGCSPSGLLASCATLQEAAFHGSLVGSGGSTAGFPQPVREAVVWDGPD